MCLAFLDPGNLEGDLQAGAIAGYWLLLWATIMGLLIQLLSARIGVVTGKHMAEICRDEKGELVVVVHGRVGFNLGADIPEVIGSAIANNILSPLWVGVIITASDCAIKESRKAVSKREALNYYYTVECSVAVFVMNIFMCYSMCICQRVL